MMSRSQTITFLFYIFKIYLSANSHQAFITQGSSWDKIYLSIDIQLERSS
jgi:hypothetical protein